MRTASGAPTISSSLTAALVLAAVVAGAGDVLLADLARNDELSGATPILTLPFVDMVLAASVTDNRSDPTCFGRWNTLWYTFTPTTGDAVEFSTVGSTQDTTILVYDLGRPPATDTVDCVLGAPGAGAVLGFSPLAGQTYAIMVGSTATILGGFVQFSARSAGPPPIRMAPGSPHPVGGGRFTRGLVPDPHGGRLYVTHPDSLDPAISTLMIGPSGELDDLGTFPMRTRGSPWGGVLNPAADRLYLTTVGKTILVGEIDLAGAVGTLQSARLGTQSHAANGIVYATPSRGDFVYVNDEADVNTVTAFRVVSRGRLSREGSTPTGGSGFTVAVGRSALLDPRGGRRLFVSNVASNDISVLDILDDGSLAPVAGSPFPMPAGVFFSGAIALDPDGSALYAGAFDRRIARFAVSPAGALTPVRLSTPDPFGAVDTLEVDPCGGVLAATTDLNQIRLYDAATLAQLRGSPVVLPTEGNGEIRFSPKGDLLFHVASRSTSAGVIAFQVDPGVATCPP